MSTHLEWLNAQHTDVTGSASPGAFEGDEEANEVAAIRITSQYDGDGIVIQGRPEQLLALAKEITRTAELIVEQTMRDPELRAMYGLVSA